MEVREEIFTSMVTVGKGIEEVLGQVSTQRSRLEAGNLYQNACNEEFPLPA